MSTAAVTYTFTGGTDAVASEVNTNFSDLVTFLNNSIVHVDGSKAMTGILALPASDPTTANQATRKSYVDATASAEADAAEAAAKAASVLRANCKFGVGSGTTNGAGDIAFSHGLGHTPTSVTLTPYNQGGSSLTWHPTVENISDTQVNVRFYDADGSGVQAGIGVTFFWLAIYAP